MSKRILVISPSLTVGGLQKAALEMALLLRDSGFAVGMGLLFKHKRFFELPKDVPCFEPSQEATGTWARMKQMRNLARNAVKQFDADVVVVYGRYYSAWVAWALRGVDVKVVMSDRNSPLFVLPLWQRAWIRWSYWVNAPVLALAQTEAALVHQEQYFGSKWLGIFPFRRKTHVVLFPNLLDALKPAEAVDREKIVLAVGRVTDPLKGMDWLLEVRSLVENTAWKWVVAGGTAEENPVLWKQIQAMNLSDKIDFLGKVKDLDSWYRKAGIFIMTSKSEGFPNALAEAMQHGMPCVAYDFVGGAKDLIVNDQVGVLVEYGHHAACAKAVEALMNDEEKRLALGAAAAESVQRLLRKNRITEVQTLFGGL